MTRASSTTSTLYDRLGGDGAVRSVVDRFYELVTADPALRPYFAGVDMSALRRHQTLFVSQVAGGPVAYEGRDMARAHAGLHIDDAAFGRVAGHLATSLREHQVGEAEIDEVLAAVGGLHDAIVQAG